MDNLGRKTLILDGSMGALLTGRGIDGPFEGLNLTKPDIIGALHKEYFDAGCDIVLSNTFGANSLHYENFGQLIKAGVKIAADSKPSGRKTYAALDIGPLGRLLQPFGDLSFDDAYNIFKEMVLAGSDADLIFIETMNDTLEMKAAVLAARENSDLPVLASFTFSDNGRLLNGADYMTAIALLSSLGVDAAGVNCGTGPDGILPVIKQLASVSDVPLFAKPNAGLPMAGPHGPVFSLGSDEWAEMMKDIAPFVRLMGGCCGTGPDYIAKLDGMRTEYEEIKNPPLCYVATSYNKWVDLRESPNIIDLELDGSLKEIASGDFDAVLDAAFDAVDDGADIIGINVDGADEEKSLKQVVSAVQSVINIPLKIESKNKKAVENAVRCYNGVPVISVL